MKIIEESIKKTNFDKKIIKCKDLEIRRYKLLYDERSATNKRVCFFILIESRLSLLDSTIIVIE